MLMHSENTRRYALCRPNRRVNTPRASLRGATEGEEEAAIADLADGAAAEEADGEEADGEDELEGARASLPSGRPSIRSSWAR